MGIEYRRRCLEYALQQCREDATVNMTEDEIIAEWGLQRSPSGPLHAAADRISALTVEVARLREALEGLLHETTVKWADADFSNYNRAVDKARATLGET